MIVTEWDAFRALDLKRLHGAMAEPVLVDLRNVYRPEDARRHGFTYASVGRPPDRYESPDCAAFPSRARDGARTLEN